MNYMGYSEYLIEKERAIAQWKILEEMVSLIHYGNMDSIETLEYEIKKVDNKIQELRLLEERYNKND